MRTLLLSICFGLLSLNAYSQSKLAGAGKATKVGGSAASKTATTKIPAKTTTPAKKSSSQASPVKRNTNDRYASSAYMEITGISFANTDYDGHIVDNYDAKLYASEVKYLKPQLSYRGLTSNEKNVTLYVKIVKEDGTLAKSADSPVGYTYAQEVTVKSGENQTVLLTGWGSRKGGSYTPGLYKYEIWFKDKLIFKDEVRLYSGATPVVQSDIFSISSISYANTDKDRNIISDYGQPLIDGKVQYLKPKIYYNGKYRNSQEITIYVRYFKSTGELVSGSSSPVGFSFKDNVTIKPGSNSVVLLGFGNEAATNYKEGNCKVELWLDGQKIYEDEVAIVKSGSSSTYMEGTTPTSIGDFFPIWGVTLGKTTWKDGANLGYTVKQYESGNDRYMNVNGDVAFWDHEGSGIFTEIYWTCHDSDFPNSWKEKGFSWDNSYNTWVNTFKSLGFTINVTKEPTTRDYDNRKTLSAEFEALSKDGVLLFDMDFDYGDNGYNTSSPKTLYSLTVRYLGK